MTQNVIQFAPLFDAIGAHLNLDSKTLNVEIIEYPHGKKTLINHAVDEITHYLDTRTFNDGIAVVAISKFVDGHINQLSDESRRSFLEALGLTKDGKYIQQVLALQKVNKSWHSSEVPNTCSYFGEICTHRGIEEVKGKRGRKSTRNPNEYHERKSNGTINREQLVTPALEALWRAIPQEVMVSATKPKNIIRLDEIEKMQPDEIKELLARISEIEEARNAT